MRWDPCLVRVPQDLAKQTGLGDCLPGGLGRPKHDEQRRLRRRPPASVRLPVRMRWEPGGSYPLQRSLPQRRYKPLRTGRRAAWDRLGHGRGSDQDAAAAASAVSSSRSTALCRHRDDGAPTAQACQLANSPSAADKNRPSRAAAGTEADGRAVPYRTDWSGRCGEGRPPSGGPLRSGCSRSRCWPPTASGSARPRSRTWPGPG